MKNTTLIIVAIITSFVAGFAANHAMSKKTFHDGSFKRVTGIGGIFFKSKDPGKLRQWYKTHLGLQTNDYGAVFEWRQAGDSTQKGFLQWSPFNEKTGYFKPSEKEFMINYRVADMDALLKALRAEGVTITDSVAEESYGKFVHILDLEGNKLELWEPNDKAFEKLGAEIGAKTTW